MRAGRTAADPQFVNEAAYEWLRTQVYPLRPHSISGRKRRGCISTTSVFAAPIDGDPPQGRPSSALRDISIACGIWAFRRSNEKHLVACPGRAVKVRARTDCHLCPSGDPESDHGILDPTPGPSPGLPGQRRPDVRGVEGALGHGLRRGRWSNRGRSAQFLRSGGLRDRGPDGCRARPDAPVPSPPAQAWLDQPGARQRALSARTRLEQPARQHRRRADTALACRQVACRSGTPLPVIASWWSPIDTVGYEAGNRPLRAAVLNRTVSKLPSKDQPGPFALDESGDELLQAETALGKEHIPTLMAASASMKRTCHC